MSKAGKPSREALEVAADVVENWYVPDKETFVEVLALAIDASVLREREACRAIAIDRHQELHQDKRWCVEPIIEAIAARREPKP